MFAVKVLCTGPSVIQHGYELGAVIDDGFERLSSFVGSQSRKGERALQRVMRTFGPEYSLLALG